MPRVPTYDGLQAATTSLPQTRIQAPNLPDAGRNARQAGQDMMQAGNALGNMAMDMQREANEIRVNDALNQAKEQALRLTHDKDIGFTNIKGKDALERQGGKPLSDEYAENLQKSINDIAAGLGNDVQKKAFSQTAAGMVQSMRAQAMQHEASEFKAYSLSVSEGVQATAINEVGLNWRNPEAIDRATKRIQAETYRQAGLLGKSAEWQESMSRKMVSNAHRTAVMSALENGATDYADGYLKKYAGSMEADDLLTVRAHVTKEVEARQAFNAASAAVSSIKPLMAPTDFDRIVNITIQTESAGNPNAVSPKGARGLMQVMPETAKNPGYGIKPSNGTPEDDVRVGKEYLGAMAKKYGGDMAKAWAAYNAGPGALDEAMQRANASRSPGADWLTFMPKETQDYVAKNLKAFSAGMGAPKPPTLADVQSAALKNIGENASPSAKRAALQEAERQFDDQLKAKKQADDAALEEAQRVLIASNGDMTALTASQRQAIPPGQMDSIMNFAGKLAKGEAIGTDWGLYYQLNNDPQLLKITNLMALRHKLGNTEFKQLADEQVKLSKGDDRVTQLQSANDVLKTFLAQAGINPSPKFTDTADVEKVARITAEFQQRINERERAAGRKLNANELREEAAAMFQPVKVAGFLFDSQKTAAEVVAGDSIVVPDTDRAQIKESLRKAGRQATEQAIEALYRARLRLPMSN